MKFIGLSGKICSGKSTIANFLRDQYGYKIISFATALKELCAAIAEFNVERNKLAISSAFEIIKNIINISNSLGLTEVEKEILSRQVPKLMAMYEDVLDTSVKTDRVRDMLQTVATILRDEVNQDIWANSGITKVKNLVAVGETKFIIDDLRYPNETNILRKNGFTLVRLNVSAEVQQERVNNLYGDIDPARLTFISEIALDNAKFDHIIDADQDMNKMLLEFVNKVGL